MGKVYSSFVRRPLQNWNVEHRAADAISKTKPATAPRHTADPITEIDHDTLLLHHRDSNIEGISDYDTFRTVLQKNSSLGDRNAKSLVLAEQQKLLTTKNEQLNDFLRGANVHADKIEFVSASKRDRPLPLNRLKFDSEMPGMEYGYMETGKKIKDKCSLKQAIEFIGKHNTNETDASTISTDFALDKQTVDDVIKHFHVLLLQVPKTKLELEEQEKKNNVSRLEA